MYKFKKEQVLDPVFLTKLVWRFRNEYVPRFENAQNYYRVRTKIEKRTMEDGKPNNRLAHGFCRYITNMATSYFAGKPIRYLLKDGDNDAASEEYKKSLGEVFESNHIDALNFEVAKEASKKGVGFYLLFINEDTRLRIKKMDAESFIPIYSVSLDEFLEAAVHIWAEYDIEGTLKAEYADVYDDQYIYHYKRENGDVVYKECGIKEWHMLGDVPVIVVWNNDDQLGDFEPHISLNDAYDNAQSDTANDMDYFTDAYLCVAGASDLVEEGLSGEGNDEDSKAVKNLRKNRILFLDEHGQAQWLVKQTNDTANENYKNRLYKDIFFLSQVPALSDESFAGNLSGIAIKYKMIGLEELAIMKENHFRPAQTKMIKIITNYLNLLKNKKWDSDRIEQKYDRNFVENVADLIKNITDLEGIISKKTQLDMLPASIVADTDKEIEKIQEEALQSEKIPKVSLEDL